MRRVVKVGGSLFKHHDLIMTLDHWICRQGDDETLVIVGGGDLINAIRSLDGIRPGIPSETHWLCVDLLDVTFQLVSKWFDWPTVKSVEQMRRCMTEGFAKDRPTLIAVRSFYCREPISILPGQHVSPQNGAGQREHPSLPANWQTTTDSIAALLAYVTNADELVILKSCEIDPDLTWEQLADHGIVDEAFPEIAPKIPSVRIEQLAHEG